MPTAPWQKNNCRPLIRVEPKMGARSVRKSFRNSSHDQATQVYGVQVHVGLEELLMAKLAIGDFVANGKVTGEVAAVFITTEGQFRYAIENDGALQFALEAELLPYLARDQAA
jgi:hypothetical protein